MGLSTEAKARYNKTNRHNSQVARVPASSCVKRTVRYIFGASSLTNFSWVYLYVKKRPFTKAQTQFTCCHTYIKLVLFRSAFFSVFYFYHYKKTKTRKTLVAGGEERRNSCHSDSWTTGDLTRIMPFRAESKWLWLWLSVGFCRQSESLVKFINQYYDIFFSCTSQVEIAISRFFQDRILRRVTRTSGPCCSGDKSVLF